MLLAVAYILLIASVLVLIISSTVNIYAHSPDLYRYGFAKYQISRVTGISNAQLEEVAQKMVGYFNANSQTPQVVVDKGGLKMPVYSEKELVHLEDVGKIIFIFKILQILSIVIFESLGPILSIVSSAAAIIVVSALSIELGISISPRVLPFSFFKSTSILPIFPSF